MMWFDYERRQFGGVCKAKDFKKELVEVFGC